MPSGNKTLRQEIALTLLIVLFCCPHAKGGTIVGLPQFIQSPQNQLLQPGTTATFYVVAADADHYQWLHNGQEIPSGTNAVLTVTNIHKANSGYYNVVVTNATGVVASELAYLSVVSGPGGLVPMNNDDSTNSQARWCMGCGPAHEDTNKPIFPGWAQVYVGPQLDRMEPVGPEIPLSAPGYFHADPRVVATVDPGEAVFYQVVIRFPVGGGFGHQSSSIIALTAGGDSWPVPSTEGLLFFGFIGGYAPVFFPDMYPTPQVRLPGETVELHTMGWTPCELSSVQWRRNGTIIPGATKPILTITNFQAAHVGIYDMFDSCGNTDISPKYNVRLQTQGGEGRFLNARAVGSGFASDFRGAPLRKYAVQRSTNLLDWSQVLILTNSSGASSFTITNISGSGSAFLRSVLQRHATVKWDQ